MTLQKRLKSQKGANGPNKIRVFDRESRGLQFFYKYDTYSLLWMGMIFTIRVHTIKGDSSRQRMDTPFEIESARNNKGTQGENDYD